MPEHPSAVFNENGADQVDLGIVDRKPGRLDVEKQEITGITEPRDRLRIQAFQLFFPHFHGIIISSNRSHFKQGEHLFSFLFYDKIN